MKLTRAEISLAASDYAEARVVERTIEIAPITDADVPVLVLKFPDRTPDEDMEAVAAAVNTALQNAAQLEPLGRD